MDEIEPVVVFFAPSTMGFYISDTNAAIPPDAVVITEADRQALLAGQSAGKIITVGANGLPMLMDPPPPASDSLIDAFSTAIYAHVQAVAAERNYISGADCATYISSTVPAWAAQAVAFVAWRDAVWVKSIADLAAVQAGTMPLPTIEAQIASFAPIAWPS